MKHFYFQCETKSIERLPDGKGVKIKGFASTPDLDRHEDIVLPEAFIKTLSDYKARGDAPALLRGHNPDYVAGTIPMSGEDAPVISDAGFFITGIVDDAESADDAEAGRLRTFSIGYIPIKSDFQMRPTGRFDAETGQELFREARILKELDLVEVSLVSTPANPNALFTVTKSLTKMFNSIPSSPMKLKCDVCGQEDACGRIGTRFIGKACIEKMQFKAEEVKALPEEKPVEKKEEEKPAEEKKPEEKPAEAAPAAPPEESTPSKPENGGETPPAAPAPEEGGDKGAKGEEEKVVVSKEDKARLTEAAKKFAELDAATVAESEAAPAAKATPPAEIVQVNVDTKQLGDIFASLANVLTQFKGRLDSIEHVLKSTPVYKGKSIMAFTATKQVATEGKDATLPTKKDAPKSDDGFVSMLKAAKNSPTKSIVLGSDDEE